MTRGRPTAGVAIVAAALLASGCLQGEARRPPAEGPGAAPRWTSRAIPESRGEVKTLPDGRKEAVRYRGWTTADFGSYRTYAYADGSAALPIGKSVPPTAAGDPARGRRLFMDRNLGPCTGCHLIQGTDVWPAGNIGPDLSTFGDRHAPDAYVFQ